jgi:DNA-binding CsgD family transcriptional regulator
VAGPFPLYGRDAEWQRILDLLGHAAAGNGACVVIDGAQKMGKTRLLTEAVRAARGAGIAVSTPPRLPNSVHELVAPYSPSGRPMLVAIDDVAVDSLVALPVTELVRVAAAAGVAFALTVNTAAAGPALRGVFVDTVRLGPLDAGATRAIAADLLGVRPGPGLRELLAAAGGNPWLVTELVEGLLDEGSTLDGELMPNAPLPRRVHAAVQSRMSTLPPRAVHLVWVAAVLGRSFALGELTAAMGESAVTLLLAVDEVLRSSLLICDGDRLAFQSELVWRVALESIPLSVRGGLSEDVRAPRPVTRLPVVADGSLTEQELRIAGLVGSGLTNQQVARRLYLSPHTVNYHLRTIFRKLGIVSRVELARFADVPSNLVA